MGQIIQSAFSEALPLIRSRIGVYVVMAILCAIAGLTLPFIPASVVAPADAQNAAGSQVPLRLFVALYASEILGALSIFFILPAAIRTVRPGFKMTLGRLVGLVGLGYGVAIAVMFALVLLVVPAFWLAVKWSQYTWTYLIGEGNDPLDESWHMTTGRFWQTFGFFILVAIVALIPIVIVMGGAVVLAGFVAPMLGVVLVPIAYLGYVFALSFEMLAQMRWMLHLRERSKAAVSTA